MADKFNSKSEQKIAIDDLQYEVMSLLYGLLYFAGVKADKIDDAADFYAENIDEILGEFDGDMSQEAVAVIEYMKQKKPEFFA